MRKSVIIILAILVILFIGAFFYLNDRQQSETGYKEGLKMGYLYGFNDGKDGNPLDPEGIKRFFSLEGSSTYGKAFLDGAMEGYRQGYTSGKQTSP
jgi:hypothetical protein